MISFTERRSVLRLCTAVTLIAAATTVSAVAADMPETVLRGSYTEQPSSFVRWDGIILGAQYGFSNLSADFSDFAGVGALPKTTSNSGQYGGFLGYNFQWESLVLGVEGAYNRPTSLSVSAEETTTPSSSSVKLVDYGTFRGRAGYAFGQFLPYAFVGGAIGRMNYQTISAGTVLSSRDNAYVGGVTAGLGIDVSILPNVFLRAEYEYVLFAPVSSIRTSVNTARAAIGVRF
jgi:opacity protein-like surface antigen